jgi:hypothetical protein
LIRSLTLGSVSSAKAASLSTGAGTHTVSQ